MSSSGFSRSLVIDRPGCRRAQALILCLMVAAFAALGYGGLPAPQTGLALLLVAGYGLRELRRASPRAPRFVVRIRVAGDGCFLLGLAGAPDTLVPSAVAQCWTLPGIAMGLAFEAEDARRLPPVLLFRDQVPADAWRRLAVRLRH